MRNCLGCFAAIVIALLLVIVLGATANGQELSAPEPIVGVVEGCCRPVAPEREGGSPSEGLGSLMGALVVRGERGLQRELCLSEGKGCAIVGSDE